MKYDNISTSRLCRFYNRIFDIETRAFGKDEKLFLRCHEFNRQLWRVIMERTS